MQTNGNIDDSAIDADTPLPGIVLTRAEYERIHSDFRGVWTTERTEWPDWSEVREQYMAKRTLLRGVNGVPTLFIEGCGLTIID